MCSISSFAGIVTFVVVGSHLCYHFSFSGFYIWLLFVTMFSYEPELFPGLIYRMVKPRIVLLIFVSGKVVLTGKLNMSVASVICGCFRCKRTR